MIKDNICWTVLNRKRDLNVCCIYKLTNPDGKMYIGQTSNLYRRKVMHKNLTCNDQPLLYGSFIKFGVSNHSFEIVELCKKEDLNKLEIHYINLYKTFDSEFGLNLQAGGKNGKASKATKNKMSRQFFGKKRSGQSLLNIQNALKKRAVSVLQYDSNGNFLKEWDSLTEAALGTGIKTITQIWAACKNNTKSGGFKWKRKV